MFVSIISFHLLFGRLRCKLVVEEYLGRSEKSNLFSNSSGKMWRKDSSKGKRVDNCNFLSERWNAKLGSDEFDWEFPAIAPVTQVDGWPSSIGRAEHKQQDDEDAGEEQKCKKRVDGKMKEEKNLSLSLSLGWQLEGQTLIIVFEKVFVFSFQHFSESKLDKQTSQEDILILVLLLFLLHRPFLS